jgi:hypothetical protein
MSMLRGAKREVGGVSDCIRRPMKRAAVVAAALTCFYGAAPSAEGSAGAKPEFSGVWLPNGRKNAGQWPKQPPFTREMLEAREKFAARHHPIDPEVDDEHTSCLPYMLTQQMLLIAQYPFEIIATPAQLTFVMETYGSVRRIHLDGRKPPAELLPSRMGFSTGRWEGNTLVVETTHLLPESEGNQRPGSLMQRVVERLSLVESAESGKELVSELTVHDPLVYAQPVSVRLHYKWSPDIEVGEYFCQQDLWDQNMDGNPSHVPWRK